MHRTISSEQNPFEHFSFSSVDQSMLVRPPCALCAATQSRERYRLRLGAIVRCENCGFNYVSPRLPSAWLLAKTQAWATSDVVDDERLRIAFEPRTLKIFGNLLERCESLLVNSRWRLLDVGCSTGAFLTVARQRQWDTTGIEVGEESAKYARGQLGLNVINGSLFDFDGAAESFDLIAFLEVIEHLEDPRSALRRIARWLAPGGLLLLSTPNFDSLFRRLFGTRWWVVNCEDEHIQFFTPATLIKMLETEGMVLVELRVRGIDLAGLISTALSRPGYRAAGEQNAAQQHLSDYHLARTRKERLKSAFARIGLLALVRCGLTGLAWLFSVRGSPLYSMGEQIIVIAQKPR
jgi:2-polyprenyl-3-methyl-5-hydroxy-6-metoxy-1,4-benzoquinol methylase